jgi:NADH-quinone oxidoreductase subunit C
MSTEAPATNPQPISPKPAAPLVASAQAPKPTATAAPPVTPIPAEVVPVPDSLAQSPIPFLGASYALKGYHAAASVEPDKVVYAAEQLDKAGFSLDTITGVDWLAEEQMEIVYDYFHPTTGLRAVVRSRVPRTTPEIPSISTIYPGANWHERETHDFFGIQFKDHPNLTPFLLPEDATYHPLGKDFTS